MNPVFVPPVALGDSFGGLDLREIESAKMMKLARMQIPTTSISVRLLRCAEAGESSRRDGSVMTTEE
jgi:hypothetical protein